MQISVRKVKRCKSDGGVFKSWCRAKDIFPKYNEELLKNNSTFNVLKSDNRIDLFFGQRSGQKCNHQMTNLCDSIIRSLLLSLPYRHYFCDIWLGIEGEITWSLSGSVKWQSCPLNRDLSTVVMVAKQPILFYYGRIQKVGIKVLRRHARVTPSPTSSSMRSSLMPTPRQIWRRHLPQPLRRWASHLTTQAFLPERQMSSSSCKTNFHCLRSRGQSSLGSGLQTCEKVEDQM